MNLRRSFLPSGNRPSAFPFPFSIDIRHSLRFLPLPSKQIFSYSVKSTSTNNSRSMKKNADRTPDAPSVAETMKKAMDEMERNMKLRREQLENARKTPPLNPKDEARKKAFAERLNRKMEGPLRLLPRKRMVELIRWFGFLREAGILHPRAMRHARVLWGAKIPITELPKLTEEALRSEPLSMTEDEALQIEVLYYGPLYERREDLFRTRWVKWWCLHPHLPLLKELTYYKPNQYEERLWIVPDRKKIGIPAVQTFERVQKLARFLDDAKDKGIFLVDAIAKLPGYLTKKPSDQKLLSFDDEEKLLEQFQPFLESLKVVDKTGAPPKMKVGYRRGGSKKYPLHVDLLSQSPETV